MHPKKKRRITLLIMAALLLGGSTLLIGYAMRDGINLFYSPTQITETPPSPGEVLKIGGLVKEGSIVEGTGPEFSFVVTDGGQEIPVRYVGNDLRPDLFDENQGTIATGTMEDGVFLATEILAKHDETYMPREVIDALKEQGVYQDPGSES
jgi:cytochrome c-type biogenesis protein CcmE